MQTSRPVSAIDRKYGDTSALDIPAGLAPRENRVMILPDETLKHGNIFVAQKPLRERPGEPFTGVILALGPTAAEDLRVGMHVLAGHYQWAHMKVDGRDVVLVTDREVHGVIPSAGE